MIICVAQKCTSLGRFHTLEEFHRLLEEFYRFHRLLESENFENHGFTGKLLIYGHKTRLYAWCKKCAFLGRFHNLEDFHEFLWSSKIFGVRKILKIMVLKVNC